MKKIFTILLIAGILLVTGCGVKKADNVLKNIEKKLNNAKSYYIEGEMEIINNEDTYTYDVKVSYAKDDYYKIELINKLNNHEQVILRNDDGVYVVTPSLNKSFKFQSDWPYNNSQVYLLDSIISDIKNDSNHEFSTKDKGYYFKSTVNYPNNKSLIKQKVYVNNNEEIDKVEVIDKDDKVQIRMNFTKIELNKKFPKNNFELSNLLNNNTNKKNNKDTNTNNNESTNKTPNTSNNSNTENNTTTNTENNNNNTEPDNNTTNSNNNTTNENTNKAKETATIKDVVYPMYLPENTYLTSQESIDTDNGKRLILTFGGDSSFVLVEEVASYSDEAMIIPVSGEFDFLSDVIGVINNNSILWQTSGMEYYITSDTIETSELLDIARSISVLPVSK